MRKILTLAIMASACGTVLASEGVFIGPSRLFPENEMVVLFKADYKKVLTDVDKKIRISPKEFENSRNVNNVICLKFIDGDVFYSSNLVGRKNIDLNTFRAGSALNLKDGFDGVKGPVDYFHSKNIGARIKFGAAAFGSCLFENLGNLKFISKNIEMSELYVFPSTGYFILENDDSADGIIKKVKIHPANNQYPVVIDGYFRNTGSQSIDLQMGNVGKVDIVFK